MKSSILRIRREPNWLGKFRIEYDGKYITLFGEDLNYPGWCYGIEETTPWYEEMILHPVACEGRNLSPKIIEETTDYLYIDIGDERESLAWVKTTEDIKYNTVFESE